MRAVNPSKSDQPRQRSFNKVPYRERHRGGADHQPAQGVPSGRHLLGEARRELPGDSHRRCDRAAVAGVTLQYALAAQAELLMNVTRS